MSVINTKGAQHLERLKDYLIFNIILKIFRSAKKFLGLE